LKKIIASDVVPIIFSYWNQPVKWEKIKGWDNALQTFIDSLIPFLDAWRSLTVEKFLTVLPFFTPNILHFHCEYLESGKAVKPYATFYQIKDLPFGQRPISRIVPLQEINSYWISVPGKQKLQASDRIGLAKLDQNIDLCLETESIFFHVSE
jgi:hypothetical protein